MIPLLLSYKDYNRAFEVYVAYSEKTPRPEWRDITCLWDIPSGILLKKNIL